VKGTNLACYKVAFVLIYGMNCIVIDDHKSMPYLQRALAGSTPYLPAYTLYSDMLFFAKGGVAKDRALSAELTRRASDAGDPEAQVSHQFVSLAHLVCRHF
jgi:TPR repeat protein